MKLGEYDQTLIHFERALSVNPDLQTANAMVPLLQTRRDERRRQMI